MLRPTMWLKSLLAIGLAAAAFAQCAEPAAAPPAAEKIARAVQQEIDAGMFPGAVVLVGRPGEVLYHEAFGLAQVVPDKVPMRKDSIFDLASVTKVVATGTAFGVCVDQGRLDFQMPIRDALPDLHGAGIDAIQVWHLATHTSGFDNTKYDGQAQGEEMLERMLGAAPKWAAGSRYYYSCLNMILLGRMVERAGGQRLDVFCRERIFAPLGMRDTTFGPLEPSPRVVGSSAPGIGQIEDGQARAAGRAVGNAGLFSTAADLARFCEMMLGQGKLGDAQILSRAAHARMTRNLLAPPLPAHAFCWDMDPAATHRPPGLTASAYGHSGHTGQSVWIDPEKKVYLLVLTNRTHPRAVGGSRMTEQYRARARIGQAALEALSYGSLPAGEAWPSARTCRVAADALRIDSGWQRQGTVLVAHGAGRASTEIILPRREFAVWARLRGKIELTAGPQSWSLRHDAVAGWQRAGSVAGGRLPVSIVGSDDAEFQELLFSSAPGFAPATDEIAAVRRPDGLLLSLDFEGVDRQACRDRASGRTYRTVARGELDEGPWGHALRCTRAGLQIDEAPTLASADEALTAAAWVRPEATHGYQALLFKGQRSGDSMAIHFHFGLCDGMLELKFADRTGKWSGLFRGAAYPVPAIPPGRWSHVAAAFHKGMIRLYVDGREVAARQGPVERLIPNSHPLCVGQGQDPQGRPAFVLSGLIDEPRVYGRALAAADVAALYAAGRGTHVGTVAPAVKADPPPVPTFARKLKIVERYEAKLPADTIGGSQTTAAVRPHEGVPALWINDRPVAPIAMIPIGHFPRDVCRDFAAAGVHVYSHILWTWARIVPESKARSPEECNDWWLGPGRYAFERVDRQIQAIVEADPQAYLFLRVKLNPPAWWVKANPDELSQHADGRRGPQYSLASRKWEETYERMLRDLIAHVEGSRYAGHIIGYQPAGGDASEWYWWDHGQGLIDYSPAARSRFREWLAERYAGDAAALAKAWNDPQATFATAEPPGEAARQASEHLLFRDARQARPVLDYQRFLTDMTVHNITKSCRICKQATQGRKISGVFYGYSLHYAATARGPWNLGFLGLKEVLDCPDVDFICSPTDYAFRRGGQPGNFVSAYTASCLLHGKLYWDEVDTRTHHYRGPEAYALESLPETLAVHQRALGYSLTKGTALWWFTLAGDHTFHEDALMEDIARLQQAARASLAVDKSPVHDIAVLADEQSFLYLRMGAKPLMQPLVREMHYQLATMGAPFDMYLLSDVAGPRMPDYKLYLFLNPFYLTDALRAAIKAKIRRNNAVAVWFYAPGFVGQDGTLSDGGVGDLTGIAVRHVEEERPLHLAITHFDHPVTAEVDRSDVLGRTEPLGPVFWADDPQAVVLGRLSPDGQAGMVLREFGTWRSVYCAAPTMSTALLRGLARYAGAHVYSTSDDVFYANHGYAMIHTATAGLKEIVLPEPRDVYDALSGDPIARDATAIRLEIPERLTRIFRLTPPQRP